MMSFFINFKKYIILIGFFCGIISTSLYLVFDKVFPNKINFNTDLIIYDAKLKKVKSEFKVAISDTIKKRKSGLMFVKSMPENNGMLFIFDTPKQVSFWMKNTYISLDLLFVDENMNIVSIFEKSTPLSEESITSNVPVKYVIELNAGIVSDYKIKPMDTVKVVYEDGKK